MPGQGSDFLGLHIGDAPPGALTTWLTSELRRAVRSGRLTVGARLPSTRVLAADRGVARGVVVEAYARLADEGLLAGRSGAGTVVQGGTVSSTGVGVRSESPGHRDGRPLSRADGVPRLPETVTDGAALDLSPGVPDLAAFPRAAWLRAERSVLHDAWSGDLGYGDPRGHPRLRAELSGWLARTRGVRADPDSVLVVAGVAQSLALLARVLRRRGVDVVAVEDPGSRGTREELAYWGLRPVPVPVDADGVDVTALERAGAAVVVLTPAHQFPTGVVLAPQRRRELLAWIGRGGLVVEDDYDAEHRYDRAPVPALQGSAPEGVAHTGSTSKSLAPGMRLGWLVPPGHLHADLVEARHASDLGSPALPQLVLADLLASGAYDRHLRLVRSRQRRRRDVTLAALRHHLPQARVTGVAAGLHLVIMLPQLSDDTDDTRLAVDVRAAGVVVQPLSWHRHAPGPPGLVLGYAAQPPDRLEEAVRRMAAVLRRRAD